MKQQIQEWAEANYKLGGHWIVEAGSADDFLTLQEAIEYCELMEEMESNTRYGDEDVKTVNGLEDIDRTGTRWMLKKDHEEWVKGQVVTMRGYFDLKERGCFTDGIKTKTKPGGGWSYVNFSELEQVI